ncbi:MAG TPA: helix-turn-helix domain-containing protein [Chitinophagaceae bacterium]|nr:helix-turn-helix domain-containing protein [Chitinophagaceae bacterium]
MQEQKNVFRSFRTEADTQLLHINRIDPVHVIDEGQKTSITIVFEPLGINHFFSESLSGIIATAGNEYSYIDISRYSFLGFADLVFQSTDTAEQLELIERFLVRKFCAQETPFLEEAISLLTDFDQIRTIPEICNQICTSPRNLSRLFNKHTGLSPVEFRNISQFRFSLHKKMESGSKALKDISYESNYSDASYMVRTYRKYTGLNPSSFFDKITVESNYVFLAL